MPLLVLLAAIVALFCPWLFLWTVPKISVLLGVVMFGMGMMLTLDDFKTILKRPKDVLIGVAAQFTIMPLIAWCIVSVFGLPQELAIGVLLVGCCPGGTASNVITYLAKGDIALSVSMTMATTLLSPLVTPCLMFLIAGEKIDIAFFSMVLSIFKIIILPIFLGIAVNTFFASTVKKYIHFLPLISITAIVMIVGGIVGANAQTIMEMGATIAFVTIIHNVLGLIIGYIIARKLGLDISKTKAISIEVGMQNSGLAASLAMTHFTSLAAIPGALFSVWHNISGTLFASYFSRK